MVGQNFLVLLLVAVGGIQLAHCADGQLTFFYSYAPCCPSNPNYDPNADTTECDLYGACKNPGCFVGIGQQTLEYVRSNDLASIYDDRDPSNNNFSSYVNKLIRISKNGRNATARIVDYCANEDCDGCCSELAQPSGYDIELEYYTCIKYYGTIDECDGTITWDVV